MNTLLSHCKVINWPKFNITIPQEIGRPEEREMEEWPVSGTVKPTQHSSVMFAVMLAWSVIPPPVTIVTSEITDHCNKYKND